MARSPRDPDEDDAEEAPDEPEARPRRARRTGGRSSRPSVRRWTPGGEAGADETEEEGEEPPEPTTRRGKFRLPGERRPVFFGARDSVYFEPLVALAILLLLLVSLWAYTQNWPPVYVVESDSMQHGTNDQVGLINTGDLVLAQKVDPSTITTYLVGETNGYQTYGEYGDVILYTPNGIPGTAPTIHRAILYLLWNGGGSYSAPALEGLPCGPNPNTDAYLVIGGPCSPYDIRGELDLYRIGWQSATVNVSVDSLGGHTGFLTMGDNNYISGSPAQGIPDQPFHSTLVEPGWIIGVARGMIPWFGALKLLLEGQAQEVPPQSWQFMGLALIAAVLVGLGVHYVFRAEGIEDQRRKDEEKEHAAAEAAEEARRPVRAWGGSGGPDDGEDETDAPPRESRWHRIFSGRPKPSVKRSEESSKDRRRRGRKRTRDDDSNL